MAASRAPGLFVALEGIDGSGKSEQCARLSEALRARGETVCATREPTEGPWGRRFRAWASGALEASPEQVLECFVEDRREHLREQIEPALRAGAIVLCDRYEASTRAYQSAHGVEPGLLRAALESAAARPADLVLWLRIPPAQAIERLARGGAHRRAPRERYERLEFLERVDAEYARLGLEAVDASAEPAAVTESLLEPILAALRARRAQ